MVALKPNASPVAGAYGALCDQTVTVYHRGGKDSITRTVYPTAFLDEEKNRNVERTGASDANGFLLVIPGNMASVSVGDKVMRGEGPAIATDAEWLTFTPAKVEGLVVVKHVDVKRLGGIVHTEAGG